MLCRSHIVLVCVLAGVTRAGGLMRMDRRRWALAMPAPLLVPSTARAAIDVLPRSDEEIGARLVAELEGTVPIRCWGVPWSRGGDAALRAVDSDLILPTWLRGEWRVTRTEMKGASFPKGNRFLSDRTPGARMASLLALPNIGNAPTGFTQRFVAPPDGSRSGAVVDAPFNLAANLEAFWPASHVTDARSTSVATVALEYASPTRTRSNVTQHVTLTTRFAEGGVVVPRDGRPAGEAFAWAEVYAQDAKEQGLRTDFKVVRVASLTAPDTVQLRLRAAAFMLPTDALYLDAEGDPVGLYDYAFQLERV